MATPKTFDETFISGMDQILILFEQSKNRILDVG